MEKKINLIVKDNDKNLRVDVFINKKENGISRTRVKNLILDKKLKLNNEILEDPSKISSPGQLKLHYSPGIPIRLNVTKVRNNEAYLLIKKKRITNSNHYFLSKKGNLREAAKNLYSTLRKIKNNKHKSIAVSKIPNKGLGKTINDRLMRASRF